MKLSLSIDIITNYNIHYSKKRKKKNQKLYHMVPGRDRLSEGL